MTIALMLRIGGIAAWIGTRATAQMQTSHLKSLQAAMTENLKAREKSITLLEMFFTSLSKVVLQNRREPDLLFLNEEGLCAALQKECCFYADHTGVIRETMEELRQRLAQRNRNVETQQGWFESWFNKPPWFTTLSTLMGPLIILLLLLIFIPCILNCLVHFIKERISVIQTLVLTHQYQALKQTEVETRK